MKEKSEETYSNLINHWNQSYPICGKAEWVKRAEKEYIIRQEGVVRNILTDLFENGTIPVALYGKSGTGKTTFLIKLIGIKEEKQEEIYKLLSCGKGIGEAKTPTALIYRKTSSNKFYYYSQNQELKGLDEKELDTALRKLRKDIEDGKLTKLEEIIIEIPKSYFKDSDDLKIQIIDLPGVNSRNKLEQKHVQKILSKYLNQAALILLFHRGNEISSVSQLFKNNLIKLYDWKIFPEKFKLMITEAYTSDSIFKKLTDEFLEKDKIRTEYLKENNPHDEKDKIPIGVNIYPLEIGESVSTLKRKLNNNSLYNKFEELQNSFIEEIREEIRLEFASNKRIKRMKEFPILIEKEIERQKEQKEKFIAKADEEIIDLDEKIKAKETAIDIAKNKKKENEKFLNNIEKIPNLGKFNNYVGKLIKDEMIKHLNLNNNRYVKYSDNLKKNEDNNRFYENIIEIIDLDSIQIEYFNCITMLEKSQFIDIPGTNIKLKVPFEMKRPKEHHRNEINSYIGKMNNKREQITGFKEKKRKKIRNNISKIENKLSEDKVQKSDYLNKKNNLVKEKKSRCNEFDKEINYLKERKEKSDITEYNKIMSQELKNEIDNLMVGIEEKSRVDKLLNLMQIYRISKENQNNSEII